MAVDSTPGSHGWFAGIGEQLGNCAEERVEKLLQRLQQGVRSVDALAKAVEGPRTDWNPYRPPRGEDLQQSILNSEVYEWRATIPNDSIYAEGKALLPPMQTRLDTSVQTDEAKETCFPPLSEDPLKDFVLTEALNAEQLSALHCENISSSSVCSDAVFPNGSAFEASTHVPSEEVDAMFDRLWEQVAVPWLLEQRRAEDEAPIALGHLHTSESAQPMQAPLRNEPQSR